MKEYTKETGSSLLAKVGLQKTKEALDAEIEATPSTIKDRSIPGKTDVDPE
jgi:hypothetical protein